MKSEAQSSEQNNLNAQSLLVSLEQDLKLPIHLNQQILSTLKRHKQLKHKFQQQQKLNQFKDQVFQNVISMFQAKQAQILNRLKSLQEINLKYMQRYLQAKKKSSKSRNPNMSLLVQSVDKGKVNKNNQQKLNLSQQRSLSKTQQRGVNQCQQREMSMKSIEDSVDLSMVQMTESIFNSQQWLEMIKHSEEKLVSIDSEDNIELKPKQESQDQTLPGQTLAKVLLKCMDTYCFQKSKQNQIEEKSFYTKKVQELIEIKKIQVQQNQSLKANIQLYSDLKRLKTLLDKTIAFEHQIKQLRTLVDSSKQTHSTKTKELVLSILEQKVQVENLIEAQIGSIQHEKLIQASDNDPSSNEKAERLFNFKERQKQVFKKICHQMMSQLQQQNQSDFLNKMITSIDEKNKSNESFIQTKLKSLEKYVAQIENQCKQQNQYICKLKEQNQEISRNLSELSMMKDKYDFYINQMANNNKGITNALSQEQSEPKPSKMSMKLNQMISRQQHQKQKQLLRECLARKDELLTIQQQQIQSSKQNLIKVQSKIKSYFQEQGIPYNMNSDKINLQQLFQNYSKSLTQNAYQRYPEQRNQMTKIMESKYQKMVQVQREQFQERIDQYKQQLQLLQRQRDSYKNSTNAQQKQFSKMKQFTQKIVIKKADLQMQNSKTQQILKSVLDMMFAYLMSNISYQSLLQQIQATIQNIKVCLKYRQREKQRESKQSPMIDYRFSGLSAVSNDYSFSKLNKESYCDYFNQDSQIEQESQVISKMSSQDQVLPPSRPSYSTNNAPKRQMGLIDINQRATMAHQDQSLLGYLNPVQIRTPRVQFQRNTVFLQSGLHDQNIRSLQSNLGYLKNRIPQQTIQVQKQVQLDAKQMYIKYKQALKCLQQAQRINQDNQVKYQGFMKELKEEGVFEAQQKVQNKLFYMSKIINEQEQQIEQQRIQFETTIAKKVMESEETMGLLMKNLNKSMSASRVVK